jgi:hypothetical protein
MSRFGNLPHGVRTRLSSRADLTARSLPLFPSDQPWRAGNRSRARTAGGLPRWVRGRGPRLTLGKQAKLMAGAVRAPGKIISQGRMGHWCPRK